MKLIAWLGLLSASTAATALPLSAPMDLDDFRITTRENENIPIKTGEPARDRTIFTVLALLFMMVLAFLFGARIRQFKRSLRMRRNLMSLLLIFMLLDVMCYIIVSAAMVAGQGLYTYALCSAGTFVCLAFYLAIKGTVYIFMVERIHIVRAPFVRRSKDKLYLSCLAMAAVFYTSITVVSFMYRVTELRASDGRCHFGIRAVASWPTLAANIFTNLVLTGIFFYLLRPVVKPHSSTSIPAPSSQQSNKTFWGPRANESVVQRNIRTLLWKSIVASLLLEIPLAANMIQFIITKGEELGMICLIICMVDVFWDCLVLYWLTFGSSANAERSLTLSMSSSRDTALRKQSTPSNTPEKAGTRNVDSLKAPEHVHVPQSDNMDLSMLSSLSAVGTITPERTQKEAAIV